MFDMQGHRTDGSGRMIQRGGFLYADLGTIGIEPAPERGVGISRGTLSPSAAEFLQRVERAEMTGDLGAIVQQMAQSLVEFNRSITSTQTAFPARENLEAEATQLVPRDTPVRNRLPRVPGAGTATQWRQATSLGGGWDTQTNGLGDTVDQPGSTSKIRAFFAESGAPADHSTVYANVSKAYKLLGTFGGVTGFAGATGASFQNQFQVERANQLVNCMLNEENALINGDSSSSAAPWGDGTQSLAFDGLLNLVTTANGTPTGQVQTSVGPLTLTHIDNQLKRLTVQGAQGIYIVAAAQEIMSLVHLAEASGSIIRVQATADAQAPLGISVSAYIHPITGERVPILYSRFMPAGTMLFMSERTPDGKPTADVSVLPQVQLPALAPNENLQGYVIQELAPTTAAPQVYPFLVSVYEVLRLKSAKHAAKSTGLTAI